MRAFARISVPKLVLAYAYANIVLGLLTIGIYLQTKTIGPVAIAYFVSGLFVVGDMHHSVPSEEFGRTARVVQWISVAVLVALAIVLSRT